MIINVQNIYFYNHKASLMKHHLHLLIPIFCCLILSSCTCNRNGQLPKKEKTVEASDIKVDIIEFQKELFACHPEMLENELTALQQKHPTFSNVYFNQVLNLPEAGDKSMQLKVMKEFISKPAMKGLYDSVQYKFSNLDFLKKDLKVLFANYKSYFPEKPTPKVYTCISEFSYSVFTATDSILAISLDKYLGSNYIFYASLFQQYTFMLRTFDQKYISIDCANVLVANLIPPPGDKSTLLDKMIAEGKILYAIHSLLPDKKNYDIIKYTEKNWEWCKKNEPRIWAFFLEENLLYNTRFEEYKYVKDGPNTYGMPSDSPGRVGAWVGLQIVEAYMREYPQTTLKELIAIKDGQKMLTGSKYKPSF